MKRFISALTCVLMACIIAVGVMYLDKPIRVSAEETSDDGYTIPDNYESREYLFEFYNKSTSSTAFSYKDALYQFTVYYPSGYGNFISYNIYDPYSWHNIYPKLYIYKDNKYRAISFSVNDLTQKKGSTYIKTINMGELSIPIFIVDNGCVQTTKTTYLSKDDSDKNNSSMVNINLTSLDGYGLWYSSTEYSWRCNDVLVYDASRGYLQNKGTYRFTVPSDVCLTNAKQNYYESVLLETNIFNQVKDTVEKYRANQKVIEYAEPKLRSAKLNSDINKIMMLYDYDENSSPSKVEIYNKLFVKLHDVDEWQTITNDSVFNANVSSDFHNIMGSLDLDDLMLALGYDPLDESVELPTVDAVIWGLRYNYTTVSGTTVGRYNTSYVFNRYVFESALIDNPDIKIDDLGNLTNITTGSNGTVTVKPGGSGNNPTISEEVDVSTINGFLKSVDFDVSSIGKAFTSLGGMVTGFATVIGNMFRAMFGNEITVLVTFGLGCLIILRVLAR